MTGQRVELEARAYGPDSTPAEIAAIQAQVTLLDQDVIVWRELPVVSPFSADVCCDRVEELARAHGCRLLLVDVTDGGRPDTATRRRLNERAAGMAELIVHVAVVVGSNPLVKAAARFIQAVMPLELSTHATVDEALEALGRVRR